MPELGADQGTALEPVDAVEVGRVDLRAVEALRPSGAWAAKSSRNFGPPVACQTQRSSSFQVARQQQESPMSWSVLTLYS